MAARRYSDRVTAGGRRAVPTRRQVLIVGALLTVAAAIAVDLAAGKAPLHAAALGAITGAAAAVRMRLADRDRGAFRFICGCIIAQPVLHFVVEFMPHSALQHGRGAIPGLADVFVASLQATLVLALVAMLTVAEQALLALAIGAARACLVRIPPTPSWPVEERCAVSPGSDARLPARSWCLGPIARRGPPTALFAV